MKIYQQIRKSLCLERVKEEKFSGMVEAEESYFGGITRKRSKKYRKSYLRRGRGTDKTPVFGIRESEGKVFIDLIPNFSESETEAITEGKVQVGRLLMTNEFTTCKGLIYKGYIHRFVEHNKVQYSKGNIHINGMENFWSWAKEHLFKYRGVFRKNLFYYLKEMEWKFNHRALRPEEKAIELAKIFPAWVRLETSPDKQYVRPKWSTDGVGELMAPLIT